MRLLVLALAFALALAGCTNGPETDNRTTLSPEADTQLGITVNTTTNDTVDVGPPVVTNYTIDHGNLSYEGAVKRWAITATENATLNASWDGQLPSVTWEQSCIVGSLHGAGGQLALAAWPNPANLRVGLRTSGMSNGFDPYPDQHQSTDPMTPFHGKVDTRLAAGETFVIELGGSTSDAFSWASPSDEYPESVLRMTLRGNHSLMPLPDAPLACGTGAEAAEGSTVGASVYVAEVEVDGTISFDTQAASTFWILPSIDLTDENAFTYRFLDQTGPVDGELSLSAPTAGTSSVTFDQSVGIVERGIDWLFVDSDWEFT